MPTQPPLHPSRPPWTLPPFARQNGIVRKSPLFKTFDVYRVSLDACRASAPIAPLLAASLRDQLVRASSSVVLNIAEGFGSFSRGVKRRHYEIARGSATECIAVLDLSVALGVVAQVSEARTLFARTAMMLAKLEARFR